MTTDRIDELREQVHCLRQLVLSKSSAGSILDRLDEIDRDLHEEWLDIIHGEK